MKHSVVVVEDDRAVRGSIEALVRSDERFRFVAAFASAEEALREIPALQPELAIMFMYGIVTPEGLSALKHLATAKKLASQNFGGIDTL